MMRLQIKLDCTASSMHGAAIVAIIYCNSYNILSDITSMQNVLL